MKVVLETTDWGSVNSPNHVYFLNDSRDKMFAYLKQGSDQVQEFRRPISFYTRGRRFQEVPNTWAFEPGQAVETAGRSWLVSGSKGAEYTVTELDGVRTCTCSGFRFRGACRHIAP
jgi:hypothetical protein